jgi:hypothetical protein
VPFWSWHAECIPQNGKEKVALAIAVGNGEGCVDDALVNAHLFIVDAANALDLLLEPRACRATLRF